MFTFVKNLYRIVERKNKRKYRRKGLIKTYENFNANMGIPTKNSRWNR